jgi:membrane-anchored protein YejM (alkaline phosphatase superfamily)
MPPVSNYTNLSTTTLIVSSVISLVIFIFAIIIWWRIFAKAGYSGALGLLMFVPLANIIVLLVLAFARWPIQKEVALLRQQVAARDPRYSSSPQYPQYPQR